MTITNKLINVSKNLSLCHTGLVKDQDVLELTNAVY